MVIIFNSVLLLLFFFPCAQYARNDCISFSFILLDWLVIWNMECNDSVGPIWSGILLNLECWFWEVKMHFLLCNCKRDSCTGLITRVSSLGSKTTIWNTLQRISNILAMFELMNGQWSFDQLWTSVHSKNEMCYTTNHIHIMHIRLVSSNFIWVHTVRKIHRNWMIRYDCLECTNWWSPDTH